MSSAALGSRVPKAEAARAVLRAAAVASAVLAAAFAGAIVVSTIFTVVMTHTVLPHEDEWYSLALFRRLVEEGGWIPGLFSTHNEHRLFFPRFVLFSDYLFFSGRDAADLVVIFATQASTTGLLLYFLCRRHAVDAGRIAVGAVVVALMFSLRQSENFVWGFQVQFVGVFASAALAVALFVAGVEAGRGRAGRARLIGAAYALALVATFTMANGLLSGLVLVAVAVLARARLGIVLTTAALAVVLIVGFGAGYRPAEGHPGLGDTARHAPRVLFYAAAYLGNFLDGAVRPAAWLGAAGLAGLCALAVPVVSGRDRDPARLTLLGIALFAVASALLTALGRAGDGLSGTMSSRYSTGAALFWSATLIAGWSVAGGPAWRLAARALVCTAALVLLAACWREQISMAGSMRERAVALGALEDGLVQGLIDEPALAAHDEPIDKVRSLTPWLRERGLSIFSEPDARLLGEPLAAAGVSVPLACSGRFAAALSRPALGRDGVVVSGTSGLGGRLREPRRVYIVDAGLKIVGLARTGFGDPAWRGYATAPPGTALGAYTLSGSGRLCDLGAAVVALGRD